MHLDTVAVMPRHQQPLLLSLVQANVAEFTRRMLAPHEDPASAGTRLELVPLLHPWKAVACHAEGRGFASLQPSAKSPVSKLFLPSSSPGSLRWEAFLARVAIEQ
jgi:hypothetical protein